MKDANMLINELRKINIELSQNQIDQLLTYYDLLIEKNKVMNLTAITEFKEVVYKHFIDSLILNRICDLKEPYSILDLGTGAGFPGIPLKIAYPNLEIILLDSLNKRIKFLDEVILKLNLNNIRTIHGRAEDYGNDPLYREKFDLCVSRAVANLSTLSEYCLPFIKKGGKFIPYKSGNINEEINISKKAIKVFGGNLEKVDTFIIPGTDIERSLVVISKEKATPKEYPRSAGKPQKEPIMGD
ncbi:16S rRNA m(7)G-527 methyltransferase [Mobilisporobacter senegalensis]|uniref:Ribosomal RNA small subunit methyltransferase G n=1 Tax=Mobilisporobacter senegalensis TaxID=1329262 RepID=A0A3N1XBM5_9FIRM|nr:16S rRNA (guanine(527)-N(7))-methyltransferase RsmG [Mobilisporobacter senegalensis]ROR22137.1 16S rRNA m(7)G-527 methyltransferase [Mobilisporobacter senegalensis]